MTVPQKLKVEQVGGQHSTTAQKRRYQKAEKLVDGVSIQSPFHASVQSSDGDKVYSVVYKVDKKAGIRHLHCDCESFGWGSVRDENFDCAHIIAANMRWDLLNRVEGLSD